MQVIFATCNSLFGAHGKHSLQAVDGCGESMPRTPKGVANESARAFLKACRKALKLTQIRLAGLTNVSQQQISKYETGKDQITLEFLRKLKVLWEERFESFERSNPAPGPPESRFATPPQVAYTAEASPEIARGSGDHQSETMMLDLQPIADPADRQKIRDLYATLLHKGGSV